MSDFNQIPDQNQIPNQNQSPTTTTTTSQQDTSAAAKDPDAWVTGDEPATASQRSYLETLANDSGDGSPQLPEQLTKADASKLIDELQDRSPRVG